LIVSIFSVNIIILLILLYFLCKKLVFEIFLFFNNYVLYIDDFLFLSFRSNLFTGLFTTFNFLNLFTTF